MEPKPTEKPCGPTLGGQMAAVRLLDALALQHPTLPAPYITVHQPEYSGLRVHLQLDGFAETEAWRSALLVAQDDVTIGPLGEEMQVTFTTRIGDVELIVFGAGPMPDGVTADDLRAKAVPR